MSMWMREVQKMKVPIKEQNITELNLLQPASILYREMNTIATIIFNLYHYNISLKLREAHTL